MSKPCAEGRVILWTDLPERPSRALPVEAGRNHDSISQLEALQANLAPDPGVTKSWSGGWWVTVSAPVVRRASAAVGKPIDDGPSLGWALEYNVRALLWEGLGLTLTEFCDAWVSGVLEGDQRPGVLRVFDLLADVVIYPSHGASSSTERPTQALCLLPSKAPALR